MMKQKHECASRRALVRRRIVAFTASVVSYGAVVVAGVATTASAEQCGIFDYTAASDSLTIRAKASNGLNATVLSYLSEDTEVTAALFSSPVSPELEAKFPLRHGEYSSVIVNYSSDVLEDCVTACNSEDGSCVCNLPFYSGNVGGVVMADGSRELLLVIADGDNSWLKILRGADTVVTCGTNSSEGGIPLLDSDDSTFVAPSIDDPFVCPETASCSPPNLTLYSADLAYAAGGGDGAAELAEVRNTNRKVVRLLRTAIRTRSVKTRRMALSQAVRHLQHSALNSPHITTRQKRSIATSIRLIRQAQRGGKNSTGTIGLVLRRLQ